MILGQDKGVIKYEYVIIERDALDEGGYDRRWGVTEFFGALGVGGGD